VAGAVTLDAGIGDGIALLTVDRPGALNAIDAGVLADLEAAVSALEASPAIGVVILTGRGRAFVAGGDIPHMARLSPEEGERWLRRGQRLLRRLERLPQVAIAAVNGYALGGGLELALACDLRVAADTAELGAPEVRVGLIPGWGGTQRLLRLVGPARARDLILTGRPVRADEALRLGLVDRVVPPDRLLPACRELARRIREGSPTAVRAAKRALVEGADLPLDAALAREALAWLQNFASPDRVEGLTAFVERRPPAWSRTA
jgi:enoyl-CoA hydratase